jgi:hypothetical protein
MMPGPGEPANQVADTETVADVPWWDARAGLKIGMAAR